MASPESTRDGRRFRQELGAGADITGGARLLADRNEEAVTISELTMHFDGPLDRPYYVARLALTDGRQATAHNRYGSWMLTTSSGERRHVLPFVAWALQRAVLLEEQRLRREARQAGALA